MDPRNLLDQMFSGNVAGRMGQAGQLAKERLNRASGAQGFVPGQTGCLRTSRQPAGAVTGLLLVRPDVDIGPLDARIACEVHRTNHSCTEVRSSVHRR
jgi:hypothetical protein